MRSGILIATMLAIPLTQSACRSTTTIGSEPSGARVYINGSKVGVTPYTYSDTQVLFARQAVMVKKSGYETVHATISRDSVNGGNLVVGILCLWPVLLWAWEYPPSYNFTLERKSESAVNDSGIPLALLRR